MNQDHAHAVRSDALLAKPRVRLDQIDAEITSLIIERMQLCLNIANIKADNNISMMQPARVATVVGRADERGVAAGMPVGYLAGIFKAIVDMTCQVEDAHMAQRKNGSGQ